MERQRKKKGINRPKSNHVFCRIDGTPLKEFKRAWWNSLKLAGIEDFHFHDLRHTFCSNLILSGASLKEIKEMIGHSDIKMTDRYSHLSPAGRRTRQIELSNHYQSVNGIEAEKYKEIAGRGGQ